MIKYTQDHEWIRMEGDVAVIGITKHATEQLGDLVFVDLDGATGDIEKEDAFIVVESVKAASDVYAPFDGTCVEVNQALADEPEKVNQDPMGEGWLVKMTLKDPSALDGLMDEAAYLAHIS